MKILLLCLLLLLFKNIFNKFFLNNEKKDLKNKPNNFNSIMEKDIQDADFEEID